MASGYPMLRFGEVTVESDDFSSFQEVVQRSVLSNLAGHGIWSLLLLFGILLLVLLSKDIIVALAKLSGRGLRRLIVRGWSWYRWRRAFKKARKAQS
jgi:hypothetical protein